MTFPVGKLGGIFDDISNARDFVGRQLDTVIDVSGSVKDGAKSTQNAIYGKKVGPDMDNPSDMGISLFPPLKSVSPIVWVGLAAIVAYFAIGKK